VNYEGNIIRPPSEVHSIILQITVGCSHNKCTFCGAYKGVRFYIKDAASINDDIAFAARYCQNQKRVFLADGDALIIPTARLEEIFSSIRKNLPWVNRINLYGSTKSILRKTVGELKRLKVLGLDRVYMGLESGHERTLTNIKKGVNTEQMIQAAEMIRAAGIFLSVTVLLGIAGRAQSTLHASRTGRVLTKMKPNQIAALTLMVLKNTPLYNDIRTGRFHLPAQRMLLEELKILVESISLDRVQFQANHASNYLPITGRLAKDKKRILDIIEDGLNGRLHLKAEHQRAL